MAEQLVFDLTSAEKKSQTPAERKASRQRFELRRASLKWLLETGRPTAAALDVVTRISKFRADIAAFWSQPVRNVLDEGPNQILRPVRTAIVQCCLTRAECWPDCVRSQELLPKLCQLKEQAQEAEAEIRRNEPELRDGAALFEEYAVWRYEDTANPEYHRLRRAIAKTEHAIYRGSQFERIRQAALADQLYLAVPEGLILPRELADGWGLLWIRNDMQVTVAQSPETRNCLDANRMHLVQNMAAASADTMRCLIGLQAHADGRHSFVQPPRLHRRPQHPTLGFAE
jgi:hypothetical protein